MSSGSSSALIGVIVGGALTLAVQVILELVRDARKTRQLSHAIAGEISALLGIIASRQYVEMIAQYSQAASLGNRQILKINIQHNYFSVVEANLQHIGMLPVELPLLVPRFLILSKSALEDISTMNNGAWDAMTAPELIRVYDELGLVIQRAIKTGHEIITLIAMLYGSPHSRYPIGVRIKMLRIKMSWWKAEDVQQSGDQKTD
jgi:hypothetical protein